MDDNGFEAKTNSFLVWLSKVGITLSPKVEVADLRNLGRGRGVVALQSLEEDEIIFSIPRSAILNTLTADKTLTPVAQEAIQQLPQWLGLTCLVLAEIQNPNSTKWSPYFAILPTSLNSLVFWTEAEISELQASRVIDKIRKTHAEDMFVQNIAPLGLGFTLEKCHHIASLIMAYAFDIPKNPMEAENGAGDGDDLVSDNGSEETTLSLIPLADILNADADKNNARLCCDNEQILEMRAIKPISPGEEILNDYGSLPQSDLLRRYGFVSDHYAQYNVTEIPTSMILSTFQKELGDMELQQRIEIASREDIYDDSYDISHSSDEEAGIPTSLISLTYLLLLSDDCFKDIQTSKVDLPQSRSKLSTEKVGIRLAHIFKIREQEYATTLLEDEELLRRGNLSIRSIMAIKVRLGEKRVLAEAIKEVEFFKGHNKRMRSRDASPAKKSRIK